MTSATVPHAPAGQEPETPPIEARYNERLAVLQTDEKRLHRQHLQLGYLRLAFGIGLVVLLLPPRWYALFPLLGFAVAARIHQRVLRHLAATRRTITFYQHGLARLQDRWPGLQLRETRLDVATSLYAGDLDLFGPGSLFELLCSARTSLGEDTLASWLLHPAPVPEVHARQAAVRDLAGRMLLREESARAPGPAVAVMDRNALTSWGAAPPLPVPTMLRWIAPVLVLLTLAAGWRYAVTHSPLAVILMLLVDGSVTFGYQRKLKPVFAETESASRALRTAGALFRQVEAQTFEAELLTGFRASLHSADRPASQALSQLATIVQWADARSNYVVRILDTPFLFTLQLALALERWRRRYGPQVGPWLHALGRFEALLSLAAYHDEHPADCFPDVREGPPALDATSLGHPLIPDSQCVRNDVSLGNGTQLLLVSGSNMSGKSTLMRSLGVNAVLAFAGAPVRARSMTLTPVNLAASIQVSDSLRAGRSRFYAEILRLRAITDAARQHGPVLFLIDEVLAGTNSSDRLAGARGLVGELLSLQALGLLSTHDLALTELAAANDKRIRNVHFEDQVKDGQLLFDYKLRDGVVERSNGLALMRMIGLDV